MKTFALWLETQYPQAIPVTQLNKLDTTQGLQATIDQYVRAFDTKLDTGISDEEARKIIDTNYKLLNRRWGQEAANYFIHKANWRFQQHRDLAAATRH